MGTMGRIADAVVRLLADGPAAADELGRRLSAAGTTRARDPAAAVRRATREDPRVVHLVDGRLASVDQALSGRELTTVVSRDERAAGRLEVGDDLAPLALLGLDLPIPLPAAARTGGVVSVRVDDAGRGLVSARAIEPPAPRAADERALLLAVAERLGRAGADRPWLAPPVTHLGAVAASVAASGEAFRMPGRPLSVVLAEAGYEVHLGWVGPPGTAWDSLTQEEVAALECDASELLCAELPAEAARVLERLVAVARRHAPDRVPAARRRLARALVRSGRGRDALAVLRRAFADDDPEDRYEAALIAYREGDEVSARRWVEDGLARCEAGVHAEVADCLADIGADIDAQAAFLRLRAGLGSLDADGESAERVAAALTGLSRSYLVEAMAEEVVSAVAPRRLGALLGLVAEVEGTGPEAARALAAVLPPPSGRSARPTPGRGGRPRLPAVAGLTGARPAAAWSTSPADAPDQQQVVVTVAKEMRRVSPLVILIDADDLGGAVKDAFFLPDMVEPRLRRELFSPMADLGLACEAVDLDEAIALIRAALARTAAIGWRIPSLEHQPVLERIDRWLLRPQRGDAGRRPVPGAD